MEEREAYTLKHTPSGNPEKQLFALESLSKLSLAAQVYNQETFEEFLVRNALKAASEQLIKRGRCRQAQVLRFGTPTGH